MSCRRPLASRTPAGGACFTDEDTEAERSAPAGDPTGGSSVPLKALTPGLPRTHGAHVGPHRLGRRSREPAGASGAWRSPRPALALTGGILPPREGGRGARPATCRALGAGPGGSRGTKCPGPPAAPQLLWLLLAPRTRTATMKLALPLLLLALALCCSLGECPPPAPAGGTCSGPGRGDSAGAPQAGAGPAEAQARLVRGSRTVSFLGSGFCRLCPGPPPGHGAGGSGRGGAGGLRLRGAGSRGL